MRLTISPSSSPRSVFVILFVFGVTSCCAWGQPPRTLSERIAIAREQHDEGEIERLVAACEASLQAGKNKQEMLDSLYRLLIALNTWEWNDFEKQQHLPYRIAVFALEKGGGEATLEAEVSFAMALCVPPQKPDASLAAERRRRGYLIVPVLRRLLANIDPNVNLDEIIPAHGSPPAGTSLPAQGQMHVGPGDIKDPAQRAEFERRIRDRELKEQRKGEKKKLLTLKKWLMRHLETYLVAAYSFEPADLEELDQLLSTLTKDQKYPDLEAMSVRIKTAVRTALASRPA